MKIVSSLPAFVLLQFVLWASLPFLSNAFTCCEYAHLYQKSPQLYGCSCTSIECETSIPGWGSPIKQGFATDCSYCEGVCWPDSNMTIQERGVPPPGPAPGENLDKMEDIKPLIFHRDQLKEDGDPIQCCFYSDKQYYYTHPIITTALNPQVYASCPDTHYGLQFIGEWYVSNLFNECFFLTATEDDE